MQQLTIEDLKKVVLVGDKAAQEKGCEPKLIDRVYALALIIFRHFLGSAWVKKTLLNKTGELDYFNPSTDSVEEQLKNTHRVVFIAEALFNLQGVPGFQRLINNLRQGKIEPIVAEIEAAVALHAAGIPFVFVTPTGERGGDYDIAVEMRFPVEVECKLESTVLTETSIRNSLDHARKQLPKNRPGFVLMKVPDSWTSDPKWLGKVTAGVDKVLRQSTRIAGVLVYWEEFVHLEGGLISRSHRLLTRPNPNAKFGLGPFSDFAVSTRREMGQWTHLVEIIRETVDVGNDGSVVRLPEVP